MQPEGLGIVGFYFISSDARVLRSEGKAKEWYLPFSVGAREKILLGCFLRIQWTFFPGWLEES